MSISASFSSARRLATAAVIAGSALSMAGCATQGGSDAARLNSLYRQATANPVRTADDRAADARRNPLEFLKFARVRPGMRVLDVSAGAGYTTQLLALTVGEHGTVWAQMQAMDPQFAARLQHHPQPNIIPVIQPFDDPVPRNAPPLDLITLIFNYHDIANLPVDRAQMNEHLFAALKPGGHMVILDHAAPAGSGLNDTWTLHRIDEQTVKNELEQAGFQLEASDDAFRNPADPRTQRIFGMTIPVDNFALRFVKPQ
ncbi:MAG TPA: methyltransferase domain-containing protein [Gallionellaceae bacterium]|nr:methyltransferase domain-containing protein [Gallionellaceae bacterium]